MSLSTPAARQPAPDPLAFFIDLEPPAADFMADAVDGLSQSQKTLPPKHFYDREGSRLFDAICETPEYYITRTEIALLEQISAELAAKAGPDATLIEFGSGSSVKIRTMLDALDKPDTYVAIDISRAHLCTAAQSVARDYPDVAVGAICADFTKPFDLPKELRDPPGLRLGFLPGSTLGNFTPADAKTFLSSARDLLGAGGALLIGIDLKKDEAILNAAYNDSTGYTAAFNRNVLTRMNRELGTALDADAFDHVAFYNPAKSRVEMHLQSRAEQTVELAGKTLAISIGETIHTENSHKYTVPEFQDLAAAAGFTPETAWTDENHFFSIHWLSVPA